MNRINVSRRRFLELTGSTGVALLGAAALPRTARAEEPAGRTESPDLIVVNANVHTVEPLRPRAEAFAIRAGLFIAVGSNEEIRNLARRQTPVFDAEHMTVVPGFIDCHNHASGEMLLYDVLVGSVRGQVRHDRQHR
jgi:hypothetical protein